MRCGVNMGHVPSGTIGICGITVKIHSNTFGQGNFLRAADLIDLTSPEGGQACMLCGLWKVSHTVQWS